MSSTVFTFLNATNTSGLSPAEAKRMRAHITRTNFAKRRQRLADARIIEPKTKGMTAGQQSQGPLIQTLPLGTDLEIGFPFTDKPADVCHFNKFPRYWSLMLPDGVRYPGNPDETAWIDFLVSDPALIESAMAIGFRNWCQGVSSQHMAEAHSSRASSIIIRRIECGRGCTDAVLGSVLTLAFGERLRHNEPAWSIHVYGLAQIIRERHSQGVLDLPSWFLGFLLLDSINDVFNFPRFYHATIVEAVSRYGYQHISDVATLCDSLIRLRQMIDAYRRYQLDSSYVLERIEESWNRLLCRTQDLRVDDNPSIQAASRAMELFLYLLWRPQSRHNLMSAARELKEALCRLQIRACAYTDLTSFQLMMGAVAADEGSSTRAWFVSKLKNAIEALQSRGWNNPLETLQRQCTSDSDLMTWFRELWKDLGCDWVNLQDYTHVARLENSSDTF